MSPSNRLTQTQFAVSEPVTWHYETRGGWGYIWHVPAYVVKVTEKRVGIAALYGDGETWVPRWVKPEKLTHGHPQWVVA